jgi:hypothetical protein
LDFSTFQLFFESCSLAPFLLICFTLGELGFEAEGSSFDADPLSPSKDSALGIDALSATPSGLTAVQSVTVEEGDLKPVEEKPEENSGGLPAWWKEWPVDDHTVWCGTFNAGDGGPPKVFLISY